MNPPRRSLARNALIIAAALLLSQLTGLLRTVVLAAIFGRGTPEADAYNGAFRITDFLFNALAGGALGSAFIPLFAGHLGTGDLARAWALARRALLAVFCVLLLLAAVCALFAPALVQIIAPGWGAAQVALTARVLRIMLASTVIFGVSGLLMGILQSNGAFLAPALAPTFYNLGILFGAAILSRWLGIEGAALGVVLGALLHLLVQLPALQRAWRSAGTGGATVDLQKHVQADLRHMLAMMGPRILGQAAPELNNLSNLALASGMATGALSALSQSFTLMRLPLAAIAQSIATALFPSISAQIARGERDGYRASLLRALRFVITLCLPAAAGLAVLGEGLVRLAFERGRFQAADTLAVALPLALYALALPAHGLWELLARGYYALRDTRTPVLVAVLGLGLNLLLNVLLVQVFIANGWLPWGGLALANSVSTWAEAMLLFIWLGRRIGVDRADVRQLLHSATSAGLATAAMGAVLLGLRMWLGSGTIATLTAVLIGAAAFVAIAWLLHNAEIRGVLAAGFARIKPSGN